MVAKLQKCLSRRLVAPRHLSAAQWRYLWPLTVIMRACRQGLPEAQYA